MTAQQSSRPDAQVSKTISLEQRKDSSDDEKDPNPTVGDVSEDCGFTTIVKNFTPS